MKAENLKTQDLLIYSRKKVEELRKQKNEYNAIFIKCIKELLHRVGATSQENKLVIEESYCSWVASYDFDEDITDARISAMWLKDDYIYCDLYAYYLGEKLENELLANVVEFGGYEEILDNLLIFIENIVLKEKDVVIEEKLTIVDIAHKMYSLIGNNEIYFDYKSYEYEEDIPYLTINDTKYNVVSAKFIDKDNLEISLVVEKDTIIKTNVCFNDTTIDVITLCENMGIYNLFMDLYYETPDADTIGDFETKFLKN